jgi:hypothetical protein
MGAHNQGEDQVIIIASALLYREREIQDRASTSCHDYCLRMTSGMMRLSGIEYQHGHLAEGPGRCEMQYFRPETCWGGASIVPNVILW